MRYVPQKGAFRLKSGREFHANACSIGLDRQGRMTTGYDGHASFDRPDPDDLYPGLDELTQQERAEIAEFMIQRWTAWVAGDASIPVPLGHYLVSG